MCCEPPTYHSSGLSLRVTFTGQPKPDGRLTTYGGLQPHTRWSPDTNHTIMKKIPKKHRSITYPPNILILGSKRESRHKWRSILFKGKHQKSHIVTRHQLFFIDEFKKRLLFYLLKTLRSRPPNTVKIPVSVDTLMKNEPKGFRSTCSIFKIWIRTEKRFLAWSEPTTVVNFG